MDRIELQGTNAIRARLAAQGAAPVARTERARPAPDEGAQSVAAELSAAGLAGTRPPIAQARVAEIRKAVEHGTYPLLPCRIADELIAAGFMLRNGK